MRTTRFVSGAILLFLLFVPSAAAQEGLQVEKTELLAWLEYFGMLAIGLGCGLLAWLVTGHQAMTCIFGRMSRAWSLWQKRVLTSSLPIYKYLVGGILLAGLGVVLALQLWEIWTEAFDIGLLVGGGLGVLHSLTRIRHSGSQIDFLEANQRYLNERKVTLFKD